MLVGLTRNRTGVARTRIVLWLYSGGNMREIRTGSDNRYTIKPSLMDASHRWSYMYSHKNSRAHAINRASIETLLDNDNLSRDFGPKLDHERKSRPEGEKSRRRLRFTWLPDHERLGIHLSLRESFMLDPGIHLSSCLKAKFMIESQGLGGRLKEGLTTLLICSITTIL